MQHLVIDISAHGFGHLAQTAAVLNALDSQHLKLTIRTLVDEAILRARIKHPFTRLPHQQEIGMLMHDALRVDAQKSFQWYAEFHETFEQRCTEAAQALQHLQADLVFANVPYVSLAGAAQAGIPAIALCSLNWADIFKAFCSDYAGADKIYAQMIAAYNSANLFLQPTPSMTMPTLTNACSIAPIAQLGIKQTTNLRSNLGLAADMRSVLVALGGIGIEFPFAQWPKLANVVWIFPDAALQGNRTERADFIQQSRSGLSYTDLLASCDVVITKTGYGTQTECIINQRPTLCVARGDWPEEPNLFQWQQQHGEVIFTDWTFIQTGQFAAEIEALAACPWQKPPIIANGAQQAAELIQQLLQSY